MPDPQPKEQLRALGEFLAAARKESGVTGRKLAMTLDVSQSTISKIERGIISPSETYLRDFVKALRLSPSDAAGLLARAKVHSLKGDSAVSAGMFHRDQEAIKSLEQSTECFRVFQAWIVPGMLQTPDYIAALFGSVASYRKPPSKKEIERAVLARQKRQRILNETGRRFIFIIHESALRNNVGGVATMIAQVDHLKAAIGRPGITIGLIPWAKEIGGERPVTGFDILDHSLVVVDLYHAVLSITQTEQIQDYLRIFESLQFQAEYEEGLRRSLGRIEEAYRSSSASEE